MEKNHWKGRETEKEDREESKICSHIVCFEIQFELVARYICVLIDRETLKDLIQSQSFDNFIGFVLVFVQKIRYHRFDYIICCVIQ